ncbi:MULTISPECIES: hypothetical protein [unclassified Pseudomonas]|uniref:hypothetical protein n=1 Tax=unclassified Pseudomonas TaxID=196821 RepID=UPI001C47DAAB|nr:MULTISPECIES: hypothetical protein [unclassified Pseudomonas]MCU1737987.1 hypothetical protein [Pseudomonas sp. 20S_6.2_Bac1]
MWPKTSSFMNGANHAVNTVSSLVGQGSNFLNSLSNVSNGGVPKASTNGLDETNDSTQALADATDKFTQEQSQFEIQKMGADTQNAINSGVMDTATKAQNAEITAGKAIQY